jgi:hypothetical protein
LPDGSTDCREIDDEDLVPARAQQSDALRHAPRRYTGAAFFSAFSRKTRMRTTRLTVLCLALLALPLGGCDRGSAPDVSEMKASDPAHGAR